MFAVDQESMAMMKLRSAVQSSSSSSSMYSHCLPQSHACSRRRSWSSFYRYHHRSSKQPQKQSQFKLAPQSLSAVPEVMSELASTTSSGGGGLVSLLQPAADLFVSLGTPQWLIKYGHPGNMFVVLTAMGGYGTLLGMYLNKNKNR